MSLTVNSITNARLYAFYGSSRGNSTNIKESGDNLQADDTATTSVSNSFIIVMQRTLKTIGAEFDLTL